MGEIQRSGEQEILQEIITAEVKKGWERAKIAGVFEGESPLTDQIIATLEEKGMSLSEDARMDMLDRVSYILGKIPLDAKAEKIIGKLADEEVQKARRGAEQGIRIVTRKVPLKVAEKLDSWNRRRKHRKSKILYAFSRVENIVNTKLSLDMFGNS